MIQVVITLQSLLETGIKVEKINRLRLFKFIDELPSRLNNLLEKNKIVSLAPAEETKLNTIG